MPISKEDIQKARRTNLIDFCERNGIEIKPEGNGNYRVVNYQGLLIKDNFYYRHSTGDEGNAVDFCMNVLGMPFKETIEALLSVKSVVKSAEGDCLWQSPAEQEKKGWFVLPTRAENTRLFSYLCKVRKLQMKLLKSMLSTGLLYQDESNNCVFPCYDVKKVPRGAILRGTYEDNVFKGRAVGSDMNYGWVYEPDDYCDRVIVVEAPIDAMSLMALYPERVMKNYLLALGGLSLDSIKTFLKENRQVSKVVLALDNDKPAQEFVEKAKLELENKYTVNVLLPEGVKDWNEMLKKKSVSA